MISDGQVKNKLDGLKVFNPLDFARSLPSRLFYLKGANMGRMRTTHPIDLHARNQYITRNCVNCMDYTHRREIAQGMFDMDYSGTWNFDTCHETCWHDRRTKNNDYMRQYYWDKKKGVVKNRRGGR